jgi:hypothetical protein
MAVGKKKTLAQCAALHALSKNGNWTAIAFQTAELSIIEYNIFKFFHTPPHLEPEMEMKLVEFFKSSLMYLITRWMEHIMCQTRITSVKKLDVIHKCHIYTHIQRRP